MENQEKRKGFGALLQKLNCIAVTGQLVTGAALVIGCVILRQNGYSSIENMDQSLSNVNVSSLGSYSEGLRNQNDYALVLLVFASIDMTVNLFNIVFWIVYVQHCKYDEKCMCWKWTNELKTLKTSLGFIAYMVVLTVIILYLDKLSSVRNLDFEKDKPNIKQAMKTSLTKNFRSDNVSSPYETSNEWNKFFMKHQCCGVDIVSGTTNDFDTTPWCTTSGSCQQTNSQIPKTCCKYSTIEDYDSARSNCHASVSSDSYYEMGCIQKVQEKFQRLKELRKELIRNIIYEGGATAVLVIVSILSSMWTIMKGIKRICKKENSAAPV
ncbi:uncharacterized protein LOC133179091 isoform X2 [Saccostrea echinata]|uniref:uncharacterized protein LOC133179091 isoform X2 n=1 Tax=Saccostrea echinata TaxID=191078 RepID=UPI002A809C59|nr:uncharacterized protein LOC133179091 isoform X2 [Saccostrea echinata]